MSLTLSELKRNRTLYLALAFIGLLFFLASGLSLLNGSKNFVIVFTMMYGEWLAVKFSVLALFVAYPALLTRANRLYYVAIAAVVIAIVISLWLLPPQHAVIWLLLCYTGVAMVAAILYVRHIGRQTSSRIAC